jgi:hypothetical protein
MYRFVCKECGTMYTSPEKETPPGIKWSDGHVCNIVSVDDIELKISIKDFVLKEYPNAHSDVKDILVEGIYKFQKLIDNKKN